MSTALRGSGGCPAEWRYGGAFRIEGEEDVPPLNGEGGERLQAKGEEGDIPLQRLGSTVSAASSLLGCLAVLRLSCPIFIPFVEFIQDVRRICCFGGMPCRRCTACLVPYPLGVDGREFSLAVCGLTRLK